MRLKAVLQELISNFYFTIFIANLKVCRASLYLCG
jgi:hypothetical protein